MRCERGRIEQGQPSSSGHCSCRNLDDQGAPVVSGDVLIGMIVNASTGSVATLLPAVFAVGVVLIVIPVNPVR